MSANESARKPSSRSRAREWVLQALYQVDLTQADPLDALAMAHAADASEVGESGEGPASRETLYFAGELVTGVVRERAEIDALIERQSHHWRLERMVRVDRNILRLAVYELLHKSAPRKVILNEAIELAKKFGTEESGAFVNGLLDKLSRTLVSDEEPEDLP